MPDVVALLKTPRARVVLAIAAAAAVFTASVFLFRPSTPSNSTPANAAWGSPTLTGSPTTGVDPSTEPEPSTSDATGGPPASQPTSGSKPVITNLNGTADGLTVTVTFTVQAAPERAPLTCQVRFIPDEPRTFPCGIGQASTTFDVGSVGEQEITAIVTDKFGVSSSQASKFFTVPQVPLPVVSDAWAWSGFNVVYVNFSVTAVKGDHPRCEIKLKPSHPQIARDVPCEGDVLTHVLDVPAGKYEVTVTAHSQAWHPPPYPEVTAAEVTVEDPPAS